MFQPVDNRLGFVNGGLKKKEAQNKIVAISKVAFCICGKKRSKKQRRRRGRASHM